MKRSLFRCSCHRRRFAKAFRWPLAVYRASQQKPAVYSLAKGVLCCSGCMANMEVKAPMGMRIGLQRQPIGTPGRFKWLDAHTVEIIAKKARKTMLPEVDAISLDGSTLTQIAERHDRSRDAMALMPFPAPGAPTKLIDRGTLR